MKNQLDLKREALRSPLPLSPAAPAPQGESEKLRFRLIAREILSDVEHLLAQHLLLSKIEIEKSTRFAKAAFAMGLSAAVFGFAAGLSLVRSLALVLAQQFAWTPATTEFVTALLYLLIVGVCAFIAVGAMKKLKELPIKLSKQWKEEWQWLRKTL